MPETEEVRPQTVSKHGEVLAATVESVPSQAPQVAVTTKEPMPATGADLGALIGIPALAVAGMAYLRSRNLR